MYVCRRPQKGGEKHKVTVHGAPRRGEVYIQWGAAWFPKGIVNDTAVSTPVTCSPRHDLNAWCVLALLTPASILLSKSTMSCYVKQKNTVEGSSSTIINMVLIQNVHRVRNLM
jgi:hypothetical protein